MKHVLEHEFITNAIYQEVNKVEKSVVTVEFKEFVKKELPVQMGKPGRGGKYHIKNNWPLFGRIGWQLADKRPVKCCSQNYPCGVLAFADHPNQRRGFTP